MVKVGISGFGRIGRLALRRILSLPDVEVVAINNRTVGEIMAHLLKYDSVHGTMKEDVAWEDGFLVIDGKRFRLPAKRMLPRFPGANMARTSCWNAPVNSKIRKKLRPILITARKRLSFPLPAKMRISPLLWV